MSSQLEDLRREMLAAMREANEQHEAERASLIGEVMELRNRLQAHKGRDSRDVTPSAGPSEPLLPSVAQRPRHRSVTFEGLSNTSTFPDTLRPSVEDSSPDVLPDPAHGIPPVRNTPATTHQQFRAPSAFSMDSNVPMSVRIEKIPRLAQALSDGIEYSPRLWQRQVEHTFQRYRRFFMDESHKKDWLLDQCEGQARSFLEPLFLDDDPEVTAEDLMNDLVDFIANPHEKQTARDKYNALYMKPRETFWEFYHEFRILAQTAGMRNPDQLKMDLRDKILPRLRKQLHSQYKNTHTLKEWVAEIQAEDQGQEAERTVYAHQHDSSSTKKAATTTTRTTSTTAYPPRAEQRAYFNAQTSAPRPSFTPRSDSPGFQQRSTTPARYDTPRAQTPANAPRHFSQGQTSYNRPQTPVGRVNAIEEVDIHRQTQDDDDEDQFEDARAQQLSDGEELTPRPKEDA